MTGLFVILGLLFQCFVYGQQNHGQVQVLLERANAEHEYSLGLLKKVSENISLDMTFPSDEYVCHVDTVKIMLKNQSTSMNELLKRKNETPMLEGFRKYLKHMKEVIAAARPDLRKHMRGNLQRLFINFFAMIQKGLMGKIKSCEVSKLSTSPNGSSAVPALAGSNNVNEKRDAKMVGLNNSGKSSDNYENIDADRAEEIFLSNTLLEISVKCKNNGNEAQKQLNFLGSFSKCNFSASAISNSFFSKTSAEKGMLSDDIPKTMELESQISKQMEELQKLMNVSKVYSDIFFPHLPHLRGLSHLVHNNATKEEVNASGERNPVVLPKSNELYPEVSLRDLNNFKKILEETVESEMESTDASSNASEDEQKLEGAETEDKKEAENLNEIKNLRLVTENILDDIAKSMQEESEISSDEKTEQGKIEEVESEEKISKGLQELDELFNNKLPYEMQLADIQNVASEITEKMLRKQREEEEAKKQQNANDKKSE